MDNQQLIKRIDELEKKVKSLEQSNTISYQVDFAFQGRGFLKQLSVDEVDPLAWDSLNTLVPTPSGDFPVIAFPIRWLKINTTLPGNQNFLIPVYTLEN